MAYGTMHRYRKPEVRNIMVKFAGTCLCCGAVIKAGEVASFYPVGTIASRTTSAIAHVGGLDGNSPRCTAVRRAEMYPDPGELAADRWNEQNR